MSRINWTSEKVFFRLLNNKSEKTYWENIRVLRERPTQEVFDTSIELTKNGNPKIRKIGIDILAQLGTSPRPFYKESNILFFDLLENEKNPKVLMTILYAIGYNQEKLTKQQICRLCELQYTENQLIKQGLVFALIGIDNTKAIETLIYLSSDKLNYIRDWATFGIGTLIERNNKKIINALWNRINDKHQDTRFEAIVGLAKRKDSRIDDIIIRELNTGEFGTLLFEAILEIGNKAFLPMMRQLLENERLKSENTNPEWLKELEECIGEMEKNTDISL